MNHITTTTSGIYLLEGSPSILDEIQQSQTNEYVRTIRGSKCQEAQGVFDEFTAAFQFPHYFGENWAALNDCLSDVFSNNSAVSILIRNAHMLLSTNEQELMLFYDMMQSYIIGKTNDGYIKIILQCPSSEIQLFKEWLVDNEIALAN